MAAHASRQRRSLRLCSDQVLMASTLRSVWVPPSRDHACMPTWLRAQKCRLGQAPPEWGRGWGADCQLKAFTGHVPTDVQQALPEDWYH